MADLWVKYRNKKSGAEGVCKYSDYRSAIRRTDKLTIVERYDGRPGGGGKLIEEITEKPKEKPEEKAPVKEPEAAKQAKANKEKASKAKATKKEK